MDVLMWMLADVLRGCRDDAPLVRGLYAGRPGGFYNLRHSAARH